MLKCYWWTEQSWASDSGMNPDIRYHSRQPNCVRVSNWPSEVSPAGSSCQAEQLQPAAAHPRLLLLLRMKFPLNSHWEQETTSEGETQFTRSHISGQSSMTMIRKLLSCSRKMLCSVVMKPDHSNSVVLHGQSSCELPVGHGVGSGLQRLPAGFIQSRGLLFWTHTHLTHTSYNTGKIHTLGLCFIYLKVHVGYEFNIIHLNLYLFLWEQGNVLAPVCNRVCGWTKQLHNAWTDSHQTL